MQYFRIKQEIRIGSYPQIKHTMIIEQAWSSPASLYCEVKAYKSNFGFCALPFIEFPCFIISMPFKKIVSAYQIGGRFRHFIIDDPYGKGLYYYFYQPPILACLSDESEFISNTIKKLVLDAKLIGPHKVFQVAGLLERYLIVDEEVLEMMLCDGIYPIQFERVRLEGGEDIGK